MKINDDKHICPRCDGTGKIQVSNTQATEKQMKLFKTFKKYLIEKGHPPSIRRLAALEFSSVTSTYNKLIALVDKGILGRNVNGKAHSWHNFYIKKDIERR